MRRDEKKYLIIGNKGCLCYHGGMHKMKERNVKYIPGILYNKMKEIFIKDWNMKSLLGIHLSEDVPDLNN